MQRIYLVTKDGAVSTVHMPYELALSKLRTGEIEEVYEIPGVPETFKGVRLREYPARPSDCFYRGSLDQSKCTLTESDATANAGAASEKRVQRAREKVSAWPYSHDDRAVVISAGIIHGATIVSSLPA